MPEKLTKIRALWTLRYVLGALFLSGVGLAFFIWAWMRYPMYAGAGTTLLMGVFFANVRHARRDRERTNKLVEAAFRDTYASLTPLPSLNTSPSHPSYGYPSVEVKFHSKAALEIAVTQNEAFKEEIAKIFKNYGSRTRPFSADQGIFFTYDGYLDEMRKRFRTDNQIAKYYAE